MLRPENIMYHFTLNSCCNKHFNYCGLFLIKHEPLATVTWLSYLFTTPHDFENIYLETKQSSNCD